MRILRDYILKEFFYAFAMSITVFTFVLVVGNLIKIADLIINKSVDTLSVIQLFMYLIPWLLSFTIPVASLTAVMLTFGRLSSDGELIAMKASGISLFRVAVPVLIIGIIFSFVAFFINDQISPAASFASRGVIKDIGMKNPTAALEEGTFIRGFGNYIIFIHEIDGKVLSNIRVYQPQAGRATRTIVAEWGEFKTMPEEDIIELALHNGTSEEPAPNEENSFYKLNFKTYHLRLDISKYMKKDTIQKKTREMNIRELNKEIESFRSQGVDTTQLKVEIYKKINLSIATFILVLIGIPMGIRAHRSEKSIGFGMSLLIFGIYWGFFLAGIMLALRKTMDPALAVSLPNALFFILGTAAFIYVGKK